MNKTHLYATTLLLSCGAAPFVAVAAGPWRSLLEDHSAPAWRGWKEPGLPAECFPRRGRGGNSGIFYRGTRERDHIYWSAPEYQLLDDANTEDGRSRLTAAAADYALYGAPAGVVLPFNHWNKTRLVVKGTRVEYWLNGRKVVQYDFKSSDWKSRVAASKFAAYPNYGLATTGLIGLQGDHPGELAIRRMRIRELP